jgi:hypothetical protein
MGGQFLVLICIPRVYVVPWSTKVAVIIAKVFGAVIVVVIVATEGVGRRVMVLEISQKAFGFVVKVVCSGINGSSRVGNEMVSEVVESVFHIELAARAQGHLNHHSRELCGRLESNTLRAAV